MRINRRTIIISPIGFTLSGCSTLTGLDAAQGVGPTYEGLIRQIKYDIGSYLVDNPNPDPKKLAVLTPNVSTTRAIDNSVGPAGRCRGNVRFAIAKVKVTVSTTSDSKDSANGGLKIPLGLVTLSPSASGYNSQTNSVTSTIEMYPTAKPVSTTPGPIADFNGTPIKTALEQLVSSLNATADTQPCFTFNDPEGKANSVKWGFTVVKSRTAGAKFEVLIFSVGAEGTTSRTVANTVEVSIQPYGSDGSPPETIPGR